MEANSKHAIEVIVLEFEEPKEITPEMEANSVNAMEVSPETKVQRASAFRARFHPTYQFGDLPPGSYILSKEAFDLTEDVQDIDLILAQNSSPGQEGAAHLYYQLVNLEDEKSHSVELSVKQNLLGEKMTISFPDVQKGKYKLLISNYKKDNGPAADGNGYTYYR